MAIPTREQPKFKFNRDLSTIRPMICQHSITNYLTRKHRSSWMLTTMLLLPLQKTVEYLAASKFPHTYIQKNTKSHHIRYHGRSTVGNKGERNSNHRHQPHYHTDVNKYLPKDHGGDSKGQNRPEHTPAGIGNIQPPEQQDKVRLRIVMSVSPLW